MKKLIKFSGYAVAVVAAVLCVVVTAKLGGKVS